MKKPQLVSVKLTEATRQILKVLAAHLDTNIYEVAEAVCHAELNKRHLKMPKKEVK